MGPFVWIILLYAAGVAALVLVVVAVVATTSARTVRDGEGRPALSASTAARDHARRVHVAAWCALVAAAAVMATVSQGARGLEAGRITGLVLAAGGLAFLAVSALGELTWPRPTGSVRTASLTRRTVADVTPRPAGTLLATVTALLVVALVTGGLTALDDGRSYGRTEVVDGVVQTWASSPYPGWFYAVPLLLAAGAILAAALLCLVLVARRPAISDATAAWDLALRRLSAQRALRGATFTLGATAAPVYGLLALPFLREGPVLVAVLFLLGALASIAVAATAAALPGPLVPATSPPRSGEPTGSPHDATPGSGPGRRSAGASSRFTAAATDAVRRLGGTS